MRQSRKRYTFLKTLSTFLAATMPALAVRSIYSLTYGSILDVPPAKAARWAAPFYYLYCSSLYADQVHEFGLTAIFISPLTNAILSAWLKTPFTSSSAAGLRELRLLISCQTSDIPKWDFDTNERECRAFRTAWVMVCASKMWSAIQLDWSQPILLNTHTSAHTWLSHWYLKMLHSRLILYKHAVGTPISGSPILGAVANLQVRRCQWVRINQDIVNWRRKDHLKDRWSGEQIGDSQHEFEMTWVHKPANIRRTHWYQRYLNFWNCVLKSVLQTTKQASKEMDYVLPGWTCEATDEWLRYMQAIQVIGKWDMWKSRTDRQ